MKYFNFLFIIALCYSVGCKSDTPTETVATNTKTDKDLISTSDGKVYNISVIKLLANPDKYHGKRVMLDGFLNLEFEGNGLYLHKEDYTHGLTKNAVWIDLNDSIAVFAHKLNTRYITIEATFDANINGHMDAFGGGLKNVTRVTEGIN